MIFYTVIRFNLYRNGSVRKYQRLYKTPRKFKTKEKAVRYANELFKNKKIEEKPKTELTVIPEKKWYEKFLDYMKKIFKFKRD